MGLNIKNAEVERLAAEIAAATGETKTEAIRKALQERKDRLGVEGIEERRKALFAYLEEHVWSKLPPKEERKPWTRDDYDALFE